MRRNLISMWVITVAAGTGGCATSPPPEPDTTPLMPTAVIETRIVNEGIKGFFPYESTERSYVRANMRRDDKTLKGTGTVTKFLVGTTNEAHIWRLDRDLLWSLNPDRREYTECPIAGCAKPATHPPEEQKPARPQPLHESGCTMKISNTSFTVKPTGKKREISGFATDEYLLEWKVTLQDVIARKTTSTVSVSLWTTPVSASLRKVLDVEQAYGRALAGKITGSHRASPIVPAEIGQMIATSLAGALSPADQAAFLNAGRQFEKVKGHPVSTRIEWGLQGNACAPKEGESDGLSSITGMFSKKKKDAVTNAYESKPILAFLIEIKALKMDLVRDSVFNVPKDYTQTH